MQQTAQTAPKFMAQVKARFVAPNTGGSNKQTASQQPAGASPQTHLGRPQRVTSGNFGQLSKQIQSQQPQNSSGALSHRQMHGASLMNSSSKAQNQGNKQQMLQQTQPSIQTAANQKQHHISLQNLVQSPTDDQNRQRELSGLVQSHDPGSMQFNANNAMFGSQQVPYEEVNQQPHPAHLMQQQQNNNFLWHPEQSAEPQFSPLHHSSGQVHHLDLQQQQQYALSQQQAMMLMNSAAAANNVGQQSPSPNQHKNQSQQPIFQPQSSPAVAHQSNAMFVNNQNNTAGGEHHHHHHPTNHHHHHAATASSTLLAAQMATQSVSASQQLPLPRQQPILPFGYNTATSPQQHQQSTTLGQVDMAAIQQQLQQRLISNHNMLSSGNNNNNNNASHAQQQMNNRQHQQFATQAGAHEEQNNATYEIINGEQMASSKRQPNFQINKQLRQQVQGADVPPSQTTQADLQQNNQASANPRSRSNQAAQGGGGSARNVIIDQNNMAAGQQQQTQPASAQSNKHAKASMQVSSQHRQLDGNRNSNNKQPAQHSANLNLMKQLYSAKGGVQTPPANFKGSSSSVGSRRQSGESSGMMSMGSIGTNFNEGNDVVQKPLVREFKTQGRLNRGIMPAANSQEDHLSSISTTHNNTQTRKTTNNNHHHHLIQNLAKKASPRQGVGAGGMHHQAATNKMRHAQKRGANGGHASMQDTPQQSSATGHAAMIGSQQTNEKINLGKNANNNNNDNQQQQQIQSARLTTASNTKKFKSVSESNASGPALKSGRQLMKGVMKGGNNPHPSFAQTNSNDVDQQQQQQKNAALDDKGEGNEELEFEHPQQPQDDFSPPDLSTFKSQTLPMHNSEGDAQHEDLSNISPNKISFQHSSSNNNNQEAIEKNEELMSLLACLNEQAIKELGQQDESEWETGMQRLLKAYKIMVETKNPNSFDANYKAIICYNLACCCQMQSELQDCSKYLTKAIEFVSIKLDSLKEQALSQYNTNTANQQIQSNSLEQGSLTVTNSSLTTTTIVQKNSDLIDQRKQLRGSNHPSSAAKNSSVTPSSTRNNNAQISATRGHRYTTTGKQANNTGGTSYGGNLGSNQRGSQQMRPVKSPMRMAGSGASEKHSRVTPAGSRALAQAQTQNSLYSEFNQFARTTGSKQKMNQQNSLRTTVSVNNGNQKVRGIGASGSKNAQSHAQFSKPTSGLFNAAGTNHQGSNMRGGGKQGAVISNQQQQQSNLTSAQRKREAQNNYTAVQNSQQFQQQQDQVMSQGGGKKGPAATGAREAKKATKAQKTPAITIQNWLECFNKTSNRPTRQILERSVHLTRYHCRFVLQLCAVLSQLNEHEQALSFSKKASGLATQLTEMTLILIKDETKPAKTNQDNSGIADQMSTQKPKRRKHSTSNQLDPYNTSLSKQKTTVSARFANQGTKGANSQNSSLVQSNLNQLSKDKVSQSYTMSNFHQLGACKEQQSSQALNNSGMALSYFPNPEQIKNERESLERIHTFSLKEPIDFNGSDDQIGAQTLTGNFLDPLFGSNTDRALRGTDGERDKHNLSMDAPFSGNRQRGISEGSRNSSTASNRSCSQYVPEKVKIFQKQIGRTHDIVDELIEIQKEFFKISEWNFKERRDYFQDRMAEKKKLKISFQTFEEMNKLQIEQKFKITARSALGVKNYGTDDWIFSFNIGNIMHLQTLGFDELANAKTTQSMMKGASNKRNDGLLKAGIQGSVTTQQGIRNYLMSEISKDQLLYKALYVIVSYFCIGTELRFLATLSPQKYSLKDSEIWHAKAIHIASYFLPNDCPLIQHITQSYAKHHLRPKIKRRQDQLAVLANQ